VELDDIMARYSPEAFVLHPDFHAPLIRMLEASGQYQLLYNDQLCVAYIDR